MHFAYLFRNVPICSWAGFIGEMRDREDPWIPKTRSGSCPMGAYGAGNSWPLWRHLSNRSPAAQLCEWHPGMAKMRQGARKTLKTLQLTVSTSRVKERAIADL